MKDAVKALYGGTRREGRGYVFAIIRALNGRSTNAANKLINEVSIYSPIPYSFGDFR